MGGARESESEREEEQVWRRKSDGEDFESTKIGG